MVTVAMPVEVTVAGRDWTKWSAYIEAQGLVRYEGEGAQNSIQTLPLDPPRQDVNPTSNEFPTALGREFNQSDFSHGMGQGYIHKRSSDSSKVLYLEGFDVSEIGILRHLHSVTESAAVFSGTTGKTCKQGGYTFICNGTSILRFADVTGAATTINPHNGEAATTVYDITTEGTNIYAALGVNGIHVSSDSGASWTHYSDAAAILVSFLKDRLIATTARLLYEITASGAAPSPKTTLKTGWTFTALAETGEYVYASCVYESTAQGGQSRVLHYGLDSSLNFIEKGSSVLPDDDLCYSLKGYLGMVLIGGGRINSSGGKDTLAYKAIPSESGYLPIELIADSEGAGSRDLACRAITTVGRRFLLSWSLGVDAPFDQREGIAVYDPALDSFANHLAASTSTLTPNPVLGIEVVKGRIVFTTADGIFYENLTTYVTTATLISSTADFNNPGPKNWDRTRLSYKALPAGTSITLQYTIRRPEEGVWSAIDSATVPNSTEDSFTHANIESPRWTLKIISNSSGASAPEIESFATRANQTVSETEYRIVRTFILADRLMLNLREVRMNPRTVRDYIEEQHRQIFDYYEADYPNGFYVRLSDYSIEEPSDTAYQTTTGDKPEDLYLVTCIFEGTRNP